MSVPILTAASIVTCPHGGQAVAVPSQSEALVDGVPALLLGDQHVVAGCPFAPVAPSPCVSIRWLTGATQTSVRGVPVLLQSSVGLCLNAAQVPQGPAVVVNVQQRAKGL